MYTLGINAAYHDTAACLLCDGHIIAAAEEERFTQFKHGNRPIPFSAYELPFHAVAYCLIPCIWKGMKQTATAPVPESAHIFRK